MKILNSVEEMQVWKRKGAQMEKPEGLDTRRRWATGDGRER